MNKRAITATDSYSSDKPDYQTLNEMSWKSSNGSHEYLIDLQGYCIVTYVGEFNILPADV